MKTYQKVIVGIIALILIIWAIVSGSHKASSDTIKVGVVAPLTGTAAAYGTEGKNSVVLALDEINEAGGINGKKIEYFVEDGKCEAYAALDAWNKMVSVNKVQAVFGGHCSTETLTIAPLASKSQVPIFAVFTTSPIVANEGEWLFRHVSTNEYYGKILAEQAYNRGYRKTAVITEQKDFPVTYSDSYIEAFKALGGEIVLDERFAPTDTDYRSMALKLNGTGYDSIFISAQGASTMALVSTQIRDLGLEKPELFNHGFSYVTFTKNSNGYMPAKYLIVTPYADPNSPKVQAFDASYVKKYGEIYNFSKFFETADYDMVYRWKDAATACMPNGKLDQDCIRDQFKNAKTYSGVAGDVTISSEYSPFSIITPMGTQEIVEGKEISVPIK